MAILGKKCFLFSLILSSSCTFSLSFLSMYLFNCLSIKCGGYAFLHKYSLTFLISKSNVSAHNIFYIPCQLVFLLNQVYST